MTMDMQWNLWV